MRTYATMTRSLLVLADRLGGLGVTRVVMEATSDDWKPVFYLLEAQGLECWLVNAHDVKHLPGRPKTDKLDAVWLAKVAERRMLPAKLRPPATDPPAAGPGPATGPTWSRPARRRCSGSRSCPGEAQIKLSVVASDVFGSPAGRCWRR